MEIVKKNYKTGMQYKNQNGKPQFIKNVFKIRINKNSLESRYLLMVKTEIIFLNQK